MSLASILGTNTKDIDAVIYLCCYSKELYHKIILPERKRRKACSCYLYWTIAVGCIKLNKKYCLEYCSR